MNKVSSTGIRYLIRQGDRYVIKRFIDGAYVHYASFTDFDEAKRYLEYVKENNWSLDCKNKRYRNHGGPLYCISTPKEGVYQVMKSIDGKLRQFGSFHTLEEAQRHRDYCVEHGWSKDCVLRRSNKYNLPKYVSYYEKNKRYVVHKQDSEGNLVFMSYYTNLEDAIRERDLLLHYDWDEDKLIEHDECYGSIWR